MNSNQLISVTGRAELKITPDVIRLELNFNRLFDSYESACKQAETNLTQLGEVMDECGLDRALPKTTGFGIEESYRFVYEHGDTIGKREFEGYKLVQHLQIELGVDNALLSRIIYGIGAKLQNLEMEITYDIKDMRPYKLKMLASAVKDATEKAQVMATAAGCSLGHVESISYDELLALSPRRLNLPSRKMGDEIVCFESAGFDLNIDDIEANEKVNISWALVENAPVRKIAERIFNKRQME